MFVATIADEEVSLCNQRRFVNQLLTELIFIGALIQKSGTRLLVAVACVFFAPTTGAGVPIENTLRIVDAAVDAGAGGVYLAATSGQEQPRELASKCISGVLQLTARARMTWDRSRVGGYGN